SDGTNRIKRDWYGVLYLGPVGSARHSDVGGEIRLATTAGDGLQDPLFLQNPQVVTHRLLRHARSEGEVPLRRFGLSADEFDEHSLELTEPDTLAASLGLRVRGDAPVAHA